VSPTRPFLCALLAVASAACAGPAAGGSSASSATARVIDPTPDDPSADTTDTRDATDTSDATDTRDATDTSDATEVPTGSSPPSPGRPRPVVPSLEVATTDELDFDLQPLQPLDISAGRIEVDDAGIGAGAGAGRGWAGFDDALEAGLLRNGNSAVSVAVAVHGEIVHEAAFGNRLAGYGDPAEPRDRFRIGSISKPITAITLLQLVEEGVVGLDEAIGTRLAAHLGVTDPGEGVATITVRQLLTHTAGLAQRDDLFFGGAAPDCRAAAAEGLRAGVSSTPGTSFRYSNLGYCAAGMLIEALTGISAERAAYELVLTPLGLSGLRMAPTFDPGPDEVLHPTNVERVYMEALQGAGGWVATPSDLVTIMNSLDLSTPGWKPLEADTLAEMQTPVLDASGSGRGYGMGLLLYGPGRWGHTGTIEGTHAMTVRDANGVTWAITVAGEYPSNTSQLESAFNRALAAGGFTPG
jgi:D-alanyl-D-alanine carboxypeptidase